MLRHVRAAGQPHAVLAYGEFMTPDLITAALGLAAQGVTHAVVVPLFLGGGTHVRSDTPRLAREAALATGIRIKVGKAAGEDGGVLRALAQYCIASQPAAGTRPRTPAKK